MYSNSINALLILRNIKKTSEADFRPGSEEDLAKAVSEVGPISVAIDAGHPGFQMYKYVFNITAI